MKISHFKQLLSGNNGVKISDDLIIFNDFEVYSVKNDTSKNYNSLDELIAAEPGIKQIIEAADYFPLEIDGGRGAGSGSAKMGGGFTTARKDFGENELLQNAVLNFDTAKGNSIAAVLGRFREKYGDSETEYGAAVDEQGFVHTLKSGGKTAVNLTGHAGETIVHNHPGGGNFSKADLMAVANSKARGIIATSSNTPKVATYHIQKNQNFKAKAFVKAVNRAKWPANLSYDKGADWWLKKNQRAYGYKYSSSGIVGE